MRRGLGRGLEELLGDLGPEVVMLPISELKPHTLQPREDPGDISALARSIGKLGVLQPVLVVRDGDGFALVAGQRRVLAAVEAGLKEVPAIILEADERKALEVALVENLQRKALNPVEEAKAIKALCEDLGATHAEAAQLLGMDRSTLTNKLRLLNLPDEVLKLLAEGKITEGHARALLSLKDPQKQVELAKLVAERGLSVRATEALVAGKKALKKEPSPREQELSERVSRLTGRRARVKFSKKGVKLTLEFKNPEELENFLGLLEELR